MKFREMLNESLQSKTKELIMKLLDEEGNWSDMFEFHIETKNNKVKFCVIGLYAKFDAKAEKIEKEVLKQLKELKINATIDNSIA